MSERACKVRASLCMSMDGFIADAGGGVDWLNPYFAGLDNNWEEFMGAIGAVVMGRKAYEKAIQQFGSAGDPGTTFVLTKSPLEEGSVAEAFTDIPGTMQKIRNRLGATGKDIWLMGGGRAIDALWRAGEVDRFEISLIPILLGTGTPLFANSTGQDLKLSLDEQKTHPNGVVSLTYSVVS